MGHSISGSGKSILLIAVLCTLSFLCGCKHGPWQLWQFFSARFIDPETGRVLSGDASEPSGSQHTTSEAQAYALFFALAANDRPTFNRVLSWTQTNLAAGDLSTHLPAWLWGQDKDGAWKVLDPNSASDADVWIAYSLLEAGRLWNSPTDAALGRAVMASIAKNEVVNLPGFGPMLLPGPTGFQHGDTWTLNPAIFRCLSLSASPQSIPPGPGRQSHSTFRAFSSRARPTATPWIGSSTSPVTASIPFLRPQRRRLPPQHRHRLQHQLLPLTHERQLQSPPLRPTPSAATTPSASISGQE